MAGPARKRLSYREYLELERETGLRHEYLDGQAWAMSGGTPRHSKLKSNLNLELGMKLGDGPCQAYDSDLKVDIPASGLATYPDLSVICGDLVLSERDANAVTNPTALFEVLSRGSEAYDRGDKFRHYRSLDSLRTYVLLSQDAARVEVYERDDDGTWRLRSYGAEDTVPLPTIGVELEVARVYRNLPPLAEAERPRELSPA